MAEDAGGLRQLRKQMRAAFNLAELQELCFDLGVDYEELGEGLGKSARLRNLIDYMMRNGRLPDLLQLLQEERTHIDWQTDLPEQLASSVERASSVEETSSDEETSSVEETSSQADVHESGQRHNLPPLPPNFIARTQALKALRETVLNLKQKVVNTPQATRIVALQGMGGIGKSVLATALAWDETIHQAFSDGIFWLSMGQTPMLETRQKQLANGLNPQAQHTFQDVQEGRAQLGQMLARKHCLIVLDDIWELNHATAFDALTESQSLLLLTTRNTNVVESLGAIACDVPLLDRASALQLLYQAAEFEPTTVADAEAVAVVRECGRLPLALAMIGGMVRGRPTPWRRALRRLQKADLSRIKETFPHYPYPDLLRAIQVSVEALSETLNKLDPIARYLDLAVFPKDTAVPLTTLEMLWEPAGLDELDTEDLVDAFVSRSLAQRDKDGNLHLHDLQTVYVRQNAGKLSERHNQLLDAYGEQADDIWANGPNDGYFFQQLGLHLIAAERGDELLALLSQFDWLMTKLRATDVKHLLADYDLALKSIESLTEAQQHALRLIRGAIRLASHVLTREKAGLAGQLLGRLPTNDDSTITQLRQAAAAWQNGMWLRPLIPSLTQPGGPLHQTLQLHTGGINSIAITPDGHRLVAALDDKTIRIWSLVDGVEEKVLHGHERIVNDVIVTANGRHLFSASSDHQVKMWDLETGVVIKTFSGHSRAVNGLTLTPNGRRLLSAANDKTVRVWDIGTGSELFNLQKHSDPVNAVAVTPDGKFALSASTDRRLRTWDLELGQGKFAAYKHTSWVNDVIITKDGTHAISASDDKTIKVWDIVSRKEAAVLRGHTSWVKSVALTPDNQQLLSGSQDGTVRVWALAKKVETATLQGHTAGVVEVLVSPDGQYALSASEDGTVNMWNLRQLAEMARRAGHTSDVRAITIVGTQAITAANDGTIKVWELDTGKEVASLNGHTDGITAVAVAPDQKQLLTASTDGTIKAWQVGTWEMTHAVERACQSLAYTADGKQVLAASGSMTVVLNLPDLEGVSTLKWHGGTVNDVTVTPDDTRVVTVANDKKIKVWRRDTGEAIATWQAHKARINRIILTPDGEYLITAAHDGAIKLWLEGESSEELTFDEHNEAVNDLALTADGRYLISVSDDRTVRVWDMVEEIAVATFHTDGEVLACAVSEDGTIVAGCVNGRVHFLKVERDRPLNK